MIRFIQDNNGRRDSQLIMPLGSLETVAVLQRALLQLIGRQQDDPISTDYLNAVVQLLEATLLNGEELSFIEGKVWEAHEKLDEQCPAHKLILRSLVIKTAKQA